MADPWQLTYWEVSVASYSKQSRLRSERVIEAAVQFFGGLGLQRRYVEAGCACFEGGGGFVAISTCPRDRGCEVLLETQEWDLQVREFLGRI